jgi:ATP-binding cassette subfamily F protein 3
MSSSTSSEDIAEEIRTSLPGTEEIIVQYLSGYLVDDAGEEEDILQISRNILESLTGGHQRDVLDELMRRLGNLLVDRLNARLHARSVPKLVKLEKVVDMSKGSMSNTIALSEGVDLESINKGKYAKYQFASAPPSILYYILSRASRVDVKKLEKQEAKLKANIHASRTLFFSSTYLPTVRQK